MDRTTRVPEYSVVRHLLPLLVLLVGSCERKETAPSGGSRIGLAIPDSGPSHVLKLEVIVDAGVDAGEQSEWTAEEVGAKLEQIFGGMIPRTAEDRAVVTFVAEHLEKNKDLDSPQPRKYFLEKREDSYRIVRLVDVEMARRYGRVRGLMVHVRRDKHGAWSVVDVMPSM